MPETFPPNANFRSKLPPFIIRGHHLRDFAFLAGGLQAPAEAAKDFRTSLQQRREYQQNGPQDKKELDYVNDVIGESWLDARKSQLKTHVLFTRFLWQPGPYPVDIVAGIPDEICAACAIGEHCRQRYENKPSTDFVTVDTRFLDFFEQKATEYGHGNQMARSTRSANFIDAPPADTPCLETTAGVVRAVLSASDIVDWQYLTD